MSDEGFADSTNGRLGAELCRYRRRPEKDVLADLGLSTSLYYLSPIFVLMLAFFFSMPLALLAGRMGARQPFATDPVWGPILIGWYAACVLLLAILRTCCPVEAIWRSTKRGSSIGRCCAATRCVTTKLLSAS